jgi:hypothetical protein
MLRAVAAFAAMLAGATSAAATASLGCSAEDKAVKFTAEGTLSRGIGEGFVGFRAELEVLNNSLPAELRSLQFTAEHLTQRWVYGREIKLRLYREVTAGSAELVVQTRGKSSDDLDQRGSYVVNIEENASPGGESKNLKLRGRASCSVG